MNRYIDAEKLKRSIEAQCRVLRAIGVDELTEMTDVLSAGFIQEIENAPTEDVAPRWTPVAERLPEKIGNYLVTCLDGGRQIDLGYWHIDERGEGFWSLNWCDANSVMAWMPLPEPYKKGEQNE